RVTLPYGEDISEAVAAFNAAPELLFKKAAPKTKAGFKEIDVKFYIPHIDVSCDGKATVFAFDCKITPTGSMKAVDLLNALNEQYQLGLPVEMADIERLHLYRMSKKGNKAPMLNNDAVQLA
ncbi:MAG: radical SAM-linked protein, partial [Phascolarctobacterium sp.]|nr:radical SAM-linked protein [Phascolarctobacterium sp.]